MRKLLDETLTRFEELERLMSDPDVLADSHRMQQVAREHGTIAKMATKYRRYNLLAAQIEETNEMLRSPDAELRELADMELPGLKEEREVLWNELLDMTIGGEDANRTNLVLEIRAGTGGDEAALFARDLYDMYKHYAESQGWKVEILSFNSTELGGFKEIVLGVDGEGCFRQLQFESGGHRVQRVPETEAKGRIHTSAATVAV
ncbi:MAG: PCRF domain-containing protein, partial [Planctomycetaceae bacterium]|nr:PCRF domain-containing protein [Planctomycetaceae bacterium]